MEHLWWLFWLVLITFWKKRLGVLNPIKNIDMSILQPSDSKFTSFLLFGKTLFHN